MGNTMARRDALATLRRHIATEREALARCEREGWEFDARAARHELARLEAILLSFRALVLS